MSNACKLEECKIKEVEQPTFKDILVELNRLKIENELLKADKSELIKERDEWKEGFTILHNRMEELNIDYTLPRTEDGEIGDLSYTDEYAKGNAEWDNLRIPKELGWDYKA